MACPRCGERVDTYLELFFGLTSQLELKLGDSCPWVPRKAIQNGGRPPDGNLDGGGYGECPHCLKDFHVLVEVRSDVLSGVRVDTAKAPFIR